MTDETHSAAPEDPEERTERRQDLKWAAMGGVAAGGVGFGSMAIGGSVVLLMFLSFPLGEADVDRGWYLWAFYAVLLGGAVAGGVFIAVVLMLFYAIRGLVDVGQDPHSSSLVIVDDE